MAPLDSFPERLAVVLFALATTTCSGAKPRVRSPDAACPALATTPLRMFSEAPGFTPLGSFSKGRAVSLQAVRVTQCGIELLPECFPNEMYVVDQSRPTLPRLVIKTDAELKQSLPFDGEEIGKKTQSWLVVETLELGVFHPERPPTLSALGSGCEGATHYVDRVWVGIGELYEWGSPTPFQTTYGKDSGLRAVAFTLRPLGNQPLEACPEGTVFDGENCVPEASELTCPLGTRESGAGCKTAPFVPPKAPARARAAESRYAELQRTTDPATRVAALRELSGYYESDEKGSRAVVYSLLTNDSAIHEACSKRPAAAAASFRRRSPQPSPRDLR
ncbi:MAG TPA: hypothetical protein VGK73_23505, partial [Polyangiaceae bacterium]